MPSGEDIPQSFRCSQDGKEGRTQAFMTSGKSSHVGLSTSCSGSFSVGFETPGEKISMPRQEQRLWEGQPQEAGLCVGERENVRTSPCGGQQRSAGEGPLPGILCFRIGSVEAERLPEGGE